MNASLRLSNCLPKELFALKKNRNIIRNLCIKTIIVVLNCKSNLVRGKMSCEESFVFQQTFIFSAQNDLP